MLIEFAGNLLPGGRAGSAGHDPFSLGRRIDILKTSNHMAISSYVAEEDKSVHGIEVPFRNFNLALVDNISAEYSFMTEMFSAKSFHQISRRAVEIFEPVFALGQAFTKQLIENTTDCLGVLLCVRLNQQAAFELQRRKVPVADSYINIINMELWPRFQVIMDMHCESLKRVLSGSGRSAVSALSLTGGDDSKQSSAPHFLTQRFGQLLHGILALSSEAGDDEPVSNSLARLRAEFDSLLTRLSRISGDAKSRERFLFNNYSLILTIISVCCPFPLFRSILADRTLGYTRQTSNGAERGKIKQFVFPIKAVYLLLSSISKKCSKTLVDEASVWL